MAPSGFTRAVHERAAIPAAFLYLVALSHIVEWQRFAAVQTVLVLLALLLRVSPFRLILRSLAILPLTLAALPFPERFLILLMRAPLALQGTLLFLGPLGTQRILQGLRDFRLPRKLLQTLGFMLRYLELLKDESQRMERARLSRTGSQPPSWAQRALHTGHLAGSLFVRAANRGDRVFEAMQSRGYDGRPLTLQARGGACAKDWLLLTLVAAVMGGIAW